MSKDQLILRQTVLEDETIPADIDLLVINAASETCIKIDGKKRQVDYMIVHDSNEEVRTQVRGRYHGDLQKFCYYSTEDANLQVCHSIPAHFLNRRLYKKEQDELCEYLKLRNPKTAKNEWYKFRKVKEYLINCGYSVEYKKDSKMGGKHYYVVSEEIPVQGI